MTINNETANIASKLISGVMQSEQANGQRQAKLVEYMFENEVTYSIDQVGRFFSITGKERTDKISAALASISDDYATAVDMIEAASAKRKASKTPLSPAEALAVEQHNTKVRAANLLFIRALTCVFHLRNVKANKVKITSTGAISFIGIDKDGDAVKTVLSGNALTRLGQKDIEAAYPNPQKNRTSNTTANPVKGGVAMSADIVHKRLEVQLANGKGLADMGDDEEASMEKLLNDLLKAKFMADGVIDPRDVLEYVKAEFPVIEPKGKASKAA